MAKKSDTAYRVDFQGHGLTRINGVVSAITDSGVVIEMRRPGSSKVHPTHFRYADILCHTQEGPGFVIVNANYALPSFAGTVVSENDNELVLVDSEGVEIIFPMAHGASGATLVQIADDDRILNRPAVARDVVRRADRAEGSGGRKRRRKAESASKPKRAPVGNRKVGRRRRA